MNNFLTLLKKDFLELKRTQKWIIYLITFVAITVFSVISARLLPELLNVVLSETGMDQIFIYKASVADSYLQFTANMGEIAFLLVTIMFSSTLVKEKTSGTYYMLKSNGVNETKIVLSHFISKLLLITISYIASIVVFVPLNLLLFKEYAGLRGVISLSYLYLVLLFGLCLSFFISSIVQKKGTGVILVIAIYFILTILSVFPYIDIYNPMYGLTLSNNIITSIDYKLSDYLINLIVTTVLSASMIISSIYIFKNKIDNRKKD